MPNILNCLINKKRFIMAYTEVFEELCEAQHKIWSIWVSRFTQGFHTRKDGSVFIDHNAAADWINFSNNSYDDLPESIKENIRENVANYIGQIESVNALMIVQEEQKPKQAQQAQRPQQRQQQAQPAQKEEDSESAEEEE